MQFYKYSSFSEQDVIHVLGKSPNSWLVSPREFCSARRWQKQQDAYILMERWCEHEQVPVTQGYIRAQVLQVTHITSNKNNQCHLKMINSMNMGGYVPAWLFKTMISQIPAQILGDLQQTHAKYLQSKK